MTVATGTGYAAYQGPYAPAINAAANAQRIDPNLLGALLAHESANFKPAVVSGRVTSPTGDVGIAEINLRSHPDVSRAQASNPGFSIAWAAHYLATLIRQAGGSVAGGLRAYNTGTSRVTPAGTAYVDQVMAHYRTLTGHTRTAAGYVSPLPRGARVGRVDQGLDLQGNPGDPVVAIGRARVDAVKADPGGFGMAVYYTLLGGPRAGQQIYVGHAQPTVSSGQVIDAGQPVATLLAHPLGNATQPGWTEIGFAKGGAPAGNGAQFVNFWRSVGGVAGAAVGAVTNPVGTAASLLPSWLNPAHVAGNIAGDAAGAVVKPLEAFFFDAVLYGVLLFGGAALVFLGVRQLFAPAIDRASEHAADLSVFAMPAGAGAAAAAAPEAAVLA